MGWGEGGVVGKGDNQIEPVEENKWGIGLVKWMDEDKEERGGEVVRDMFSR